MPLKSLPIGVILAVPMRAICCLSLSHVASTDHVSRVEVLKLVVAEDIFPRTGAFLIINPVLRKPTWADLTLPIVKSPCFAIPFTHLLKGHEAGLRDIYDNEPAGAEPKLHTT